MKYFFGVDVGGTTIKIGMFNENGNMSEKYEIPTRKEDKGSHIISDIARSIIDFMDSKGIDRDDLSGIGIGVPGPVTDTGTVLGCVNLGWDIVNVPEEMKKYIDVPCKAGNDANMAALGEMFKGGGAGKKNVVMVTLGTGVGGGIILDGRIVSGVNGAAGEIGHMPVVYDEDMPLCNCGKKGCLEQVASATGIVNTARKLLALTSEYSTLRGRESFSAKDVFDEAKSGDKVSDMAVRELAKYLGTAMAHISCVVDPDIFVIGGGVSKAGDILIDNVSKVYREKAFNPSKNTKIALATLGNDAGMYGAVKLVLE